MKFEEKLMTLRKEKGWSQEDLSNQIGVSRQTISKWESSQTTPELNKLIELSKIFEISIDELVDNLPDEENAEVEKVYTKVNFKPSYIFMGIICLLIFIVLIISVFYIYKKDSVYVKSMIMFTYEDVLTEKMEATEIYTFNEKGECLGSAVKIIVNNEEDCEKLVKKLSDNKIKTKNIIINSNRITYFKYDYLNYSKDEIIKIKEKSLENVQNLEIIDM